MKRHRTTCSPVPWAAGVRGIVKLGEPLAPYTTFKIGGNAQYYVEPADLDDLKWLLKRAKQYKIPIYILGAGSNILVADQGVKGMVIRLSSPFFRRFRFEGAFLHAGAGALLSRLIGESCAHGLAGLENLCGIPGTLGGALVMNAGVSKGHGSSPLWIGALVEEVTVLNAQGRLVRIPRRRLRFGYRSSNLADHIIVQATVRLRRSSRRSIERSLEACRDYRRRTQQVRAPSAGCVFRNPENDSAGRLIDACGLKGTCVNDACVAPEHANFIVNNGRARARDVVRLMRLIIRKVKQRFYRELIPEIRIWK